MKILFVEDDEHISSVAKMVFMRTEHDVVLSPNPKEAIKAIQNGDFDVIILDMTFPDGTGEDVLTYLSDNKINIPVLVHTGYSGKFRSVLEYYTEIGLIKKVYEKPCDNLFRILDDIDHVSV